MLDVKFFEDFKLSKPTDLIKDYPGAVYVVVGDEDNTVPSEIGLSLVNNADSAFYTGSHTVIGADHGFGIYNGENHLTQELSDHLVEFFIETINK